MTLGIPTLTIGRPLKNLNEIWLEIKEQIEKNIESVIDDIKMFINFDYVSNLKKQVKINKRKS